MAVHDLLRGLVEAHGRGVVDEPDQFRGALDDFLTEDDATTGELNLLVDAVRLGAVRRLLALLDHGAEVEASIDEVSAELARDRGADSMTGARWALQTMMFALGHDEALPRPAEQAPPARPEVPVVPPPPQVDLRGTQMVGSATRPLEVGSTLPTESTPAPAPATASPPAPAPALPPPTHPHADPVPTSGHRRRSPLVLAAVAVGVVLVAGGLSAVTGVGPLGGLLDEDTPSDSASDTAGGADPAPTSAATALGQPLSADTLVLPVIADDGTSRIYAVDVVTGQATPLTDGPSDKLPTVTPDRGSVVFLRSAPDGGPRAPYVLDLSTGEVSAYFDASSPCAFSGRPAFSPSDTAAVACQDSDGKPTGAYLVDGDAQPLGTLELEDCYAGVGSWTSESTLVYVCQTDRSSPTTLWIYDTGSMTSTQLTDGAEGSDTHPTWTDPNGVALFTRSQGGAGRNGGELWSLSQDEGITPLDAGVPLDDVAVSPDGTRMAFVADPGSDAHLVTAPFADASDTTVLDLPGKPGGPTWGTR